MKKIKQFTAIIIAMLVFALSLPTMSVFAADSDMRYGRKKLNADLQYVYDALVTGCENAQAEINIDLTNRTIDFNNDLGFVYTMFYSDYPEYFWVKNGWGASFDGTILTLSPSYSMTGSALSTAKTKYNAKVNELTSGLSGSNYDKAKALHDRLIDTVTYTKTSNDQNAYGALVEGKAVCNGYARAYQHLMNKIGIPTWYVSGTSTNPTTKTPVGHAWNIVKLDGSWYYTDATWDDQGSDTFYTYFNVTYSQIAKDHTLDSTYASLVPNATATAANYYIKENRNFTSYDRSKLVNLLKQDGNKTQIYTTGNIKDFINSVSSELGTIAPLLGASGSYQIKSSASILGNSAIIHIVIISENHTHKPTASINQVNASCLANGTKAHYICDCGLKFLDSACTKQITNDSDLVISALPHTASGYKNDASNHWKSCTACGSEIANTRSSHNDKNKDNKCDTCAYALPVSDESGNTIIGSGTNVDNSESDYQGTEPTPEQPEQDSPTNSTPSDNTESNTSEEVTESTTQSAAESVATTGDDSTPDDSADAKPFNFIIILIIGGGLILVGATAFAIVMLRKK